MPTKKFDPKLVGPKCEKSDLAAFEEFTGLTLPIDYSNFLLLFNGCIPSPDCDTYRSIIELPGGNDITIHQFFTLSNDASPLRSLYQEFEEGLGYMPIMSIPFAIDSFGNILGVDCEDSSVNWTLCEERFFLDYLRNYDLNVSFAVFVNSLSSGPYK